MNAGRILGIIATVLLVVGVIGGVALVVAGRPRPPSSDGLAPGSVLLLLPPEPGRLERVLEPEPLGLVVDALGEVRERGGDAQRRRGGHQHPVVRRQDALLPDPPSRPRGADRRM